MKNKIECMDDEGVVSIIKGEWTPMKIRQISSMYDKHNVHMGYKGYPIHMTKVVEEASIKEGQLPIIEKKMACSQKNYWGYYQLEK